MATLSTKLHGLAGFEKSVTSALLGICTAVERPDIFLTPVGCGELFHLSGRVHREVDGAFATLQHVQQKWVPLSIPFNCREDHADYFNLPKKETLHFEACIDAFFAGRPQDLLHFCDVPATDTRFLLPPKRQWPLWQYTHTEQNLATWEQNLVTITLYLTRQIRPLLALRIEQKEERKARKFFG